MFQNIWCNLVEVILYKERSHFTWCIRVILRYTAQRRKFEQFIDIKSSYEILQVERGFTELLVKYFIKDFVDIYCVKTVQILSDFWSIFSCIQFEYRKIQTRKHFQSCSYQNNRHGALYIFLNFSCKLVCGMYFSNQRRHYKWTASKCWRINSMLPLSL